MTSPVLAARDIAAGEIFTEPLLSKPYPFAARALRQIADGGVTADLAELQRTDAAAARDFANATRDELRFDNRLAAFRYFDSPVWRADQVGHALMRLQEHQEQKAIAALAEGKTKADREAVKFALRQLDARRLKSVLDLVAVQQGTALTGAEFDVDPLLFSVGNGVIDLRDGSLRDGRPSDYLSLQSPVVYDPAATCPRFSRFLAEVLQADELVGFIQRWCGYCLTALTNEQVFLCWWGAGANGKSVFASVLSYVLGTYSVTLPFASFTRSAATGSNATPDLATLPGRRLIEASETRTTSRFDEGRLKALTGEDTIAARRLYGDVFEFRPVAKLLFLFNDRPRVTDLSHGFWRRALLVPFQRQFSDAEQDRHLGDKLKAEAPGILRWAIDGCLEWQHVGLAPPPCVRSAVDDWRAESDLVAEFLGHGCEPAPGRWISTREFYAAFLVWCALEHVDERERPGRKAFTSRMAALVERRQRNTGAGFVGLRPRSEVTK